MSIKSRLQILRNNNARTSIEFEKLILDAGLNNEALNEFPNELSQYFGTGLKLWQYPNQLSKFSEKICSLNVKSYLEIGCRHGGTFIYMSELLMKNNQDINLYACDIIPMSEILQEYCNQQKFEYIQESSQTAEFKDFCENIKPEFVFIDGDHSYEGVSRDFSIFENMSETKYIVLHDISNDVCPGVFRMWELIKKNDKFETYEYIDQYESVSGNFLGIGLAVRKD